MTEEETARTAAGGAGSPRAPTPVRGTPSAGPPRWGALQIFQYNWPFYAIAAAVAAAAVAVVLWAPVGSGWKLCAGTGGALALYLAIASLVASHLVYDLSGLCAWGWIGGKLPQPPRTWVLLHAGLDMASSRLDAMFPGSEGHIVDVFDPREMTEPSIRRARDLHPAAGSIRARPAALPLPSDACDAAFLIFSAHEIRDPCTRLGFFNEVRRVLKPGGRAILVEHLRDTANFLAFGPGFLHFLPRREWVRLAQASGLDIIEEFAFTPFVRIFVLAKPS